MQQKRVQFEDDRVAFCWDFDGASLGDVQRLGPEWYFLRLREDTWFWFYFRINGVAGKQLILETKDTRASLTTEKSPLGRDGFARRPFYSYDDRHFVPFDYAEADSHEDRRFRYIQTFTEDEVYVCFGIPYTPERFAEFAREVTAHPHVQTIDLGRTRIGLPIHAWRITDPGVPDEGKRGVIILGREDQEETSAQFAYEGFLNALLSDQYSGLRRTTDLWTVPVVTLDGQKTGAQYSAGFGYASNRWDGDQFIPHYLCCIKDGIKRWHDGGASLVMAGKFHSPGIWDTTNHGFTWWPGVRSFRNAGRDEPTYFMAERVDVLTALCKYLEDGSLAKSNLEVRPVGRFERFIRDTYNVNAVWAVEILAGTVEHARTQGELVLRGMSDWLGNHATPWA